MRVSIVNCVSTAADMMRFSDASLISHAGAVHFDYIVVKWLATRKVTAYLRGLPSIADDLLRRKPETKVQVHVIEHETDTSVGYVPNLRAMMNRGFEYGFLLNEYAGLVNTDCYFGPWWLENLVKHAGPDRVVNSLHITAATPPVPVAGIVTENLGIPGPKTFDRQKFILLYNRHHRDDLVSARKLDTPAGYRECATMPYLFERRWWRECGPWELHCVDGQSPDVRFFDRIAAAGADYVLTNSSIVYHHEAVERRGKRPKGAQHLPEE